MNKKKLIVLFIFFSLYLNSQTEFIYILGNTQDAGVPHIGCESEFCQNNYGLDQNFYSTSIAVVDSVLKKYILFEATPDITYQLNNISKSIFKEFILPESIYITHAHIGHYAGLMYLGRESLGAHNINVRTLPRMYEFILKNGPWNQLVNINNIQIQKIDFNHPVNSLSNIKVTPFKVPHRDEYSETAGYVIKGKNKNALFIPDINKWELWDNNLEDIISNYDYLLLDATFYNAEEINRDINEIPHPLVIETMQILDKLSLKDKSKVYFIHMNHTNMMLDPYSDLSKLVIKKGFNIARLGQKLYL